MARRKLGLRTCVVLLAFSGVAAADPALRSARIIPAPSGAPPASVKLEVVVHAPAGLRAKDFLLQLDEVDPISIEATKVTSFKDSADDLSVVILVQGNVLFMGDPESQPEPTIGYYDVVKEAINAIARARPQHTRMGLYVYGDTVIEKVPMGPADAVTGDALGPQRDFTPITIKSLQRGLERAFSILSDEKGRRVVFIIGDGGDQAGDYSPRRDVDRLENASVEVYVLGASPREPMAADRRRLEALGRLGAYIYANQKEQVVEVAGALAAEMNNLYTVEFPAQASDGQFLPLDGKEHTFKVTAGKKDTDETTIRFPPGPCSLGPGLRACICADGRAGPPCPCSTCWVLPLGLIALGIAATVGAAYVWWKTRPETSIAEDDPELPAPAPEPAPAMPPPMPRGTIVIPPDGGAVDDGPPSVG